MSRLLRCLLVIFYSPFRNSCADTPSGLSFSRRIRLWRRNLVTHMPLGEVMRPKLVAVKSQSTNYALEYKRADGSVLRLVNTLPTTDMVTKNKKSKQPGEPRKRSITIPEEVMVLVEADAVR